MLEAAILLVIILTLSSTTHMTVVTAVILFVLWILVLPGLWLLIRISPPFLPTTRTTLKAMMDFAAIRKGEKAYDLGCGDGRIVFAAAARGAKAVGYELSLPTYLIAKGRSFLHPGAVIRYGNFWKQEYRDADIVFCFLLTRTMQEFERMIWPTLKPGCRVVSNAFRMNGIPYREKANGAYLYVK